MVTTLLSRTFFSVPVRIAGRVSSVDGGGAVRLAPIMSSAAASRPGSASRLSPTAVARMTDLVMATSRSGGRRPRRGDPRHDLVLGGSELLLIFGDRGRGERVADHVGGAAAHVEELVDAEDQEQP